MRRGLLLSLILAGCAKGPSDGSNNNVTRISVSFRVLGRINTSADDDPLSNYVYIVAIRASDEENPNPNTNPQPIFDVNPNGFVAGQPTHFVQFNSLNPSTQYPYTLYKFAKTNDPDNPIDLATFAPVSGQIINFDRPSTNGNQLRFDLYITQLADSETEALALKSLQVNILTMNRRALSTTSGRVQDFLGNNQDVSALNSAIRIDLRTNDSKANTPDFEPEGDTSDPDLDIVDWQIQVTKP